MSVIKAVVQQANVGINQPIYRLFVRPAATINTGGGGGGGGPVDWTDVQNKPATFPPAAHTQAISTVTGLQDELDRIDLQVQLVVLGVVSDPPVGPAIGDRYIVGLAATGAWAGREGDIATWSGSAWDLTTSELYWRAYSEADGFLIHAVLGEWIVEEHVPWGSIDNAKLAEMPSGRFKGRSTVGDGPVEDMTPNQARAILNVANGATANSPDAALRDRATHTGEQAISTVTGLQGELDGKQPNLGYIPEDAGAKDVPGGYAGLDGSGKINPSQLPSIAITERFVVNSQAAMLALTAQTGDIAIRTDISRTFILSGDPTILANWAEVLAPTDAVTSVFGRSGVVTAQNGDYNSDQVTEGSGNLYFTGARAVGATLTGYVLAGTWSAITATDTVLQAFGKIGRRLADLAAIAFSGSASDLSAGTLPGARFDDTSHGNRAGGVLHAAATTGAAGFMSSADKTKLDGVAPGATANSSDAALLSRANHTGTQDASTITGSKTSAFISDFSEAVDDRVFGLLVEGSGVSFSYDDVANTLTIAATGGSGGITDGDKGDVIVSGSGATWLIDPAAITGKTEVVADIADFLLVSDTNDSGALKKVLVPIYQSPQRFAYFTDFLTVAADQVCSSQVLGTGAVNAAGPWQFSGTATGSGFVRVALGTTAGGRAAWFSTAPTTIYPRVGACRFRLRGGLMNLSDATNTYTARMGIFDVLSGEPTNGLYFRYTHSVNGGRWQAVSRLAGVDTAVDTGIAATASNNGNGSFEIRTSADGNTVTFFIDDVLVATITTGLPAIGTSLGFGFNFSRSLGTAAFNAASFDYMMFVQDFPARV